MGCGNSRLIGKRVSTSNNNDINNTENSNRRVLSVRISGTIKHNKGLYMVSEAAASQEYSRKSSSIDSMKLHIISTDSKNLTY
ncbi:hypothetical protein SteCoe_38849 [Stentor coeruleus]|uniref:Uncharacterized protein n=1 Tax=Stentor coeruleus TaxID=5963 RepID=A0A1R2AKZ5_9CILI|nr:hypothetical protein SteCoe_38849 [Stentor coeruleus]